MPFFFSLEEQKKKLSFPSPRTGPRSGPPRTCGVAPGRGNKKGPVGGP